MPSVDRQRRTNQHSSKLAKSMLTVGSLFFAVGLLMLIAIYHSVVWQEVRFLFSPPDKNAAVLGTKESGNSKKIIRPVNENYGIVIPKIGANSRVIANVSPFNEKEYQTQLTKGVVQARDTAYPGQFGNTFIFAHSAANLDIANQYNAVFYLLSKLEKKDKVYIFYKEKKYVYQVTDVQTVSSDALEYLKQDNTRKQLTLMTCWPPGTTIRRLIVKADLIK